jgi:hypothetical protein
LDTRILFNCEVDFLVRGERITNKAYEIWPHRKKIWVIGHWRCGVCWWNAKLGMIPVEHFERIGFGGFHSLPWLVIVVLDCGTGRYCLGFSLAFVIWATVWLRLRLEKIFFLGLETFRRLVGDVRVRGGALDAGRRGRVAGYTNWPVKGCFRV